MSEPVNTPGIAPEASREPLARPRLRRSRQDRVIAGVCGGLGRYLGIDPVIVRIVAVVLLFVGVGLVAYIVAWIAMPETAPGEPEPEAAPADRRSTAVVIGAVLIAVGGLWVVQRVVPGSGQAMFWPLVLVGAGLAVLISARR
jgi:phage shock protein C